MSLESVVAAPSSWHSPAKIWSLGHRAVRELFDAPVQVEEKIDGSFFQFGLINGELRVRSKGAEMLVDAPEKMFSKAVDTVKELAAAGLLVEGWTYRGEYLRSPKHNALAYDRVPTKNIILFDILTGEEEYLSYAEKLDEATRLGLEIVPMLAITGGNCLDQLRAIIDNTVSCLGGQKIEGVVCKQIDVVKYADDKKALMGKFVGEAFKEVHRNSWKGDNPGPSDIVSLIGEQYRHPARWRKAIQHLREAGGLTDSPKDIGPIIKSIPADIKAECEEEIKEALFKWAWSSIARQVTRGFPEFYKEELLKLQFGEESQG